MLSRVFSILILLLMLSSCSQQPYTDIDNTQLKTMISKGIPAYDIRRTDEWQQTGIIKGSRLLTFINSVGRPDDGFIPRFTQEIKKDDPVLLICRTGNRSSFLAQYLTEKLGYTQVYNLKHGISKWIGEKNPVVQARIPTP
ncbi:MAG: rhodanese-like domain-containing protein [Magnetococcales bacterium]|nr:rhodanese-like domain-containing protein [Magnetococcales bacterium]